jgi:hypothetical protein
MPGNDSGARPLSTSTATSVRGSRALDALVRDGFQDLAPRDVLALWLGVHQPTPQIVPEGEGVRQRVAADAEFAEPF